MEMNLTPSGYVAPPLPPPPGTPGPKGDKGDKGDTGSAGSPGATGPAATDPVGVPAARTLALGTAYQATTPTKPSMVSITLQAQSSVSLGGASNSEAQIVVGPTNAVAAGTGVVMATFKNNLGGTIVAGLTLTSQQTSSHCIILPAGYWWAVRQTAGSGIQIVSAADQTLG